jgi:EpsI family protein
MKLLHRNFILLLVMLLAAYLALILRPTHRIADDGPKVNLEAMIPKQFGDWQEDKTIIPVQVSPDVKQQLDKLYSQILSRTYVNSSGQRVMLSMSYGGNQGSDEMQVHRPEYCYVAQGFELKKISDEFLTVPPSKIAVRRLEATQGARVEPITYWITIGDKATLPGVSRKIAQLKYGLTGNVPDGMLVRVSSLSSDRNKAYQLQNIFINELLNAVTPTTKVKLTGKL